jgi:hypothetical protein
MASSKEWHVSFPQPHTVRVQHKTHCGWARITVDGEVVYEQNEPLPIWDIGFDKELSVHGVPFRVRIQYSIDLPAPTYFLWVAGQLQA